MKGRWEDPVHPFFYDKVTKILSFLRSVEVDEERALQMTLSKIKMGRSGNLLSHNTHQFSKNCPICNNPTNVKSICTIDLHLRPL